MSEKGSPEYKNFKGFKEPEDMDKTLCYERIMKIIREFENETDIKMTNILDTYKENSDQNLSKEADNLEKYVKENLKRLNSYAKSANNIDFLSMLKKIPYHFEGKATDKKGFLLHNIRMEGFNQQNNRMPFYDKEGNKTRINEGAYSPSDIITSNAVDTANNMIDQIEYIQQLVGNVTLYKESSI